MIMKDAVKEIIKSSEKNLLYLNIRFSISLTPLIQISPDDIREAFMLQI